MFEQSHSISTIQDIRKIMRRKCMLISGLKGLSMPPVYGLCACQCDSMFPINSWDGTYTPVSLVLSWGISLKVNSFSTSKNWRFVGGLSMSFSFWVGASSFLRLYLIPSLQNDFYCNIKHEIMEQKLMQPKIVDFFCQMKSCADCVTQLGVQRKGKLSHMPSLQVNNLYMSKVKVLLTPKHFLFAKLNLCTGSK